MFTKTDKQNFVKIKRNEIQRIEKENRQELNFEEQQEIAENKRKIKYLPNLVTILLRCGATLEVKSAIIFDYVEIAIKLYSQEPQFKDMQGNSVLHLAAQFDRLELVKFILKENGKKYFGRSRS